MVVEVWDKKTSAQNDQLVGIAKVSLHQFYMSFRDRRIANTLLKSQVRCFFDLEMFMLYELVITPEILVLVFN